MLQFTTIVPARTLPLTDTYIHSDRLYSLSLCDGQFNRAAREYPKYERQQRQLQHLKRTGRAEGLPTRLPTLT